MLTHLGFSSFHYFASVKLLSFPSVTVVLPVVGKHSVVIAVEFPYIFWGMMFLLFVTGIPGVCQSSLQQLCSGFWKKLSVTKSCYFCVQKAVA